MALRPWDTLTPGQVQSRVKRLAAKPGTRVNIPTKYLPAQYAGQRKAAATLRSTRHTEPGETPVGSRAFWDTTDITTPINPASIHNAARELAHMEVDPAVRGYEDQIRSQTTRSKAIQDRATGYFGELLGKSVPAAQEAAKGAAETYRTSVAGAGTAAADRLAAALSANGATTGSVTPQAQAQASAASLGAQGQAAGQAADLSREAATRATGYEQFAGAAGTAVQARQADAATILASNLAQANQDLQGKAAAAKASLGPLTVQKMIELRNRAFDEQAVTGKLELGAAGLQTKLDVANISADTKLKAAEMQRRAQERGQDLTYDAAVQRITESKRAAVAREKVANAKLVLSGKGEGLTPAQVLARKDKRTNFVTNATTARDFALKSPDLVEIAKRPSGTGLADFIYKLRKVTPGLTPQQARTAYDLVTTKLKTGKQGVSRTTVKSFTGQGWDVPSKWRK